MRGAATQGSLRRFSSPVLPSRASETLRQGQAGGVCRSPPCQDSGRLIKARRRRHAALWQRAWPILAASVEVSGWRLAALLTWPDGWWAICGRVFGNEDSLIFGQAVGAVSGVGGRYVVAPGWLGVPSMCKVVLGNSLATDSPP